MAVLEKQNTDTAKKMHYVGNNEPSRPMFKIKKKKTKVNEAAKSLNHLMEGIANDLAGTEDFDDDVELFSFEK
jgi:hypothetical protein